MTAPYLKPIIGNDLRDLGIPEPWTFGMKDRVRFGEIDMLGHVNNAAYLGWLENLRIHYLAAYDIAHFTPPFPKIVIRNLGLEFISEVKLHDDYILTGRTVEMRTSSFTMNYGVFVKGKLTTTGHAVVVMLNDDNSKRPLTDAMRRQFIENDGAVQA